MYNLSPINLKQMKPIIFNFEQGAYGIPFVALFDPTFERGERYVYAMKANYAPGMFTLGAKFLQYYYTVYDMEHNQMALLPTKFALQNNLIP